MDKRVMIKGVGITKIFNNFWGKPKARALNGLDIEVTEGSITGLLGPNGAGKSTLVKLLLGHLYPTTGTLEVLGQSPKSVQTKQNIGYLPERTSFYTNLTAKETLSFFSDLLGLPKSEADMRISQLLKMVGLDNLGRRLVGEFSHGMRKRLGLAQALLNDPDLLLLDEPTAGLDPVGCKEVKELLLVLKERGKTILLTTHLLADVQDVSDTIMILYGGRLQACGDINSLLANKEEILIKTKATSEESIEEVKSILGKGDDALFEVSNPIRTLEDYFLSVISEANKDSQEISGAQKGHGVAEYLKK